MREILFRGKAKDNVEWVKGYIYKIWGSAFILWGMVNEVPYMIEVDPETVCQYTGLRDKNEKRIFEGDICEMVYDGISHMYVIVWDNEEQDFKGTNGKENYGRNFQYMGCCDEIVVLGNIFDSPDLLERSEA